MRTPVIFQFCLSRSEKYAGELEDILGEARVALESAELPGLTTEETHAKREGKLGPEWLPILTATLSAPAVLLAIRAVRDVLKEKISKDKKLSIKISANKGEVLIDSSNISEDKLGEIIRHLTPQSER